MIEQNLTAMNSISVLITTVVYGFFAAKPAREYVADMLEGKAFNFYEFMLVTHTEIIPLVFMFLYTLK